MTCKWPSFCRWIVLDELWNMLRKKSVAIVTVTRSYQRHPGGLELAGSQSNYRVVLSDWTTRKWPRKQKKYLGTPCKIIKSVNFFMANLKSYLPLKKASSLLPFLVCSLLPCTSFQRKTTLLNLYLPNESVDMQRCSVNWWLQATKRTRGIIHPYFRAEITLVFHRIIYIYDYI